MLNGAPKDAGQYKVVIEQEAYENYAAGKAEATFTITRANTQIVINNESEFSRIYFTKSKSNHSEIVPIYTIFFFLQFL